jgi:hypothetical protein
MLFVTGRAAWEQILSPLASQPMVVMIPTLDSKPAIQPPPPRWPLQRAATSSWLTLAAFARAPGVEHIQGDSQRENAAGDLKRQHCKSHHLENHIPSRRKLHARCCSRRTNVLETSTLHPTLYNMQELLIATAKVLGLAISTILGILGLLGNPMTKSRCQFLFNDLEDQKRKSDATSPHWEKYLCAEL